MPLTKGQIMADISEYIRWIGGSFGNCYVGISKDAVDRLLNGHNVDLRDNGAYRHYQAASSDEARSIERAFLKLGVQGGDGGGDDDSDMVYVYKITTQTKQ
ncbi:MAG TPA: hypothetical protein PLV42_03580 [bacterium]|nr:hypothetical protein [bacterium]